MHVLAVLLLLLTITSSWAKPPLKSPPTAPSPGGLCRTAIAAAERSWRLPAGLLPAIGRVESGRPDPQTGGVQSWPWTINAEGVGRFFETKEQAIAAVQALQARGVRSIDVGCMQVNLLHHPTAFATLDQAFDPDANAMYAGRFLSALFGQSASWPVAAAAYHSQTPDLSADYRRRVMTAWGRPELIPVPPTEPKLAAYRDLLPDRLIYRAFAPTEQVYGAFTVRPAALEVPKRRASLPSGAKSQRIASAH